LASKILTEDEELEIALKQIRDMEDMENNKL
jgi:hypothetical protein